MSSDPNYRLGYQDGYRDGYGRGRDDEAAGETVRPDPPAREPERRQQHPPRDRQVRTPGRDR